MATAKQKNNVARVTKLREDEAEARPAGQHVGDTLREARENKGLTLDMVADELMIRRFYLEALEAGSFRDLPERVYATGFVRSYATYVGLDPQQIIDQFRRDAYGSRAGNYQVELVMPEPVIHSVIPTRTVIISAICALALIIGGIVFATRSTTNPVNTIPSPPEVAATDVPAPDAVTDATQLPPIAPPSSAPATDSVANDAATTGFDLPAPPTPMANTATAPAAAGTDGAQATGTPSASNSTAATTDAANSAAGLPPATSPAALPEATAAGNETGKPVTPGLAVEATESSWVEVKDASGKMMFTGILKKGQLLPIPDQKGITLTTGNAGGLRLVLDGQAMEPLGQMNEVKRNVTLDASKLKLPQAQPQR